MVTHQSVLLQESLEGLAIDANGIYVDGTFGRGGHSRGILNHLNEKGRLIAIDKDQDAVDYAKQQFATDSRFTIFHGSFANLPQFIKECGVFGQINGILLDLGVSSPQLDTPERGFSFLHAGPLDMRMNQQQALNAEVFINEAQSDEMVRVFKEYGEERYAKRIANAIVKARSEEPIQNTRQLAEIIKQAHPKWEKHKHPATRVFQAIRIYINQELTDLSVFLKQCVEMLAIGGRLVVISFHSLEDRLVKQFMHDEEKGPAIPHHIPIRAQELKRRFKRIGKAIKPRPEEVEVNYRARSAVLRIGEKIA